MNDDEIIEKYGQDGKLAPDDTYSREVLLIMLSEARSDEREKAIAKAAEQAGKRAFTPATAKEIIELIKQPDTQITMTTKTLQELLQDEDTKSRSDTAKQIFKELDKVSKIEYVAGEWIWDEGWIGDYIAIKKKYKVD